MQACRGALFVLALFSCAAAADQSPDVVAPVVYFNRLMVQINPNVVGRTADDVLTSLASPTDNDLKPAFGNPASARLLTPLRLSATAVNDLAADDPTVALNDTLVLSYKDDDSTSRAVMTIIRSGVAVSINRDIGGSFSADPLLTVVSGQPTKYQYGLYTLNVLQSGNTTGIWAKTRGSAYVALLDNRPDTRISTNWQ